MRLSRNFCLDEFTHSPTAKRLGISNTPSDRHIACLQALCTHLLQPLRNLYGESFTINSGYRSAQLNKAVGGVASSQHCKGQAADVRVGTPRRLLEQLLASDLVFDQAILYPTFLHLSYNTAHNRCQTLYAKGVKP
ncbi:MAG: hypothetical protein RL662_436 [Bacteroidota bacterium]|jgi:hypothetical protein